MGGAEKGRAGLGGAESGHAGMGGAAKDRAEMGRAGMGRAEGSGTEGDSHAAAKHNDTDGDPVGGAEEGDDAKSGDRAGAGADGKPVIPRQGKGSRPDSVGV